MTRRDRVFVAGTVVLSVAVPALLVSTVDAAQRLAVAAGWGLALLLLVPSYFALTRTMGRGGLEFQRAFLGATGARMLFALLACAGARAVLDDAGLKVFLLSFGLGYVPLLALELATAFLVEPGGQPE